MKNKWIEAAKQASKYAYAPYSKFSVGACLVTENGTVYTGSNIENASFGLTNCAERTAFFKAVSEGESCFQHLVIFGNTSEPIAPCGACRQVMVEFCSSDMSVTLVNAKGNIQETTIGELLPYAFTKNDLSKK